VNYIERHVTEKSEAIATCKEILVFPVNKVVYKKESSEKGGPGHKG
jgi:ribosomal protein L23